MNDQSIATGDFRSALDAEGPERTLDVTVEVQLPEGVGPIPGMEPFSTKAYLFGERVLTVTESADGNNSLDVCCHDDVAGARRHLDELLPQLEQVITSCPIPVTATAIDELGYVTVYTSPVSADHFAVPVSMADLFQTLTVV